MSANDPALASDLPSTDPESSVSRAELAASPSSRRGWLSGARRRILNFTPSWFSVNMGTGIASILIKNLPYTFKHMGTIADSIFALNVFLFCVFLGASLIRYTVWPSVWHAMIHHPTQSLYIGTFPMGLCTIVSMIVYTCVPAFGHQFAIVAWVVWWITVVLSLLIGIGMPFIIHTRHKTAFDQVSGVWFLPVVTNVVCAATGGIVAEVLSPANARITLVVSYILWGVGVPVSFFLMPLYYARLAVYKLPPRAMIVSVFLPVGPCGQGAFGLLQMAKVLRKLSQTPGGLGDSGLYSPQELQVMASAIYGGSIIVALMLWGVGLFWLVNAVLTIGNMTYRQKIPFNMGWWGFTFPVGVFATATTNLAKDLDSPVLRILGTFISLCVVLLWAFVATKTAIQAWEGSIFFAPCLEGGEPPKRSSSAESATVTSDATTV